MSAPALVLLCTTTQTQEQAQHLAEMLVARRLAACVHIEAIHSVYRWQGQVQSACEYKLSAKTTAARCAAAQEALQALHPYSLPALYALPVWQAQAAYAQWVCDAVAADDEASCAGS